MMRRTYLMSTLVHCVCGFYVFGCAKRCHAK